MLMKPTAHYDIIIAGGGLAGRSLAWQLVSKGLYTSKRILLIEKELKNQNDRTWSYWEKEPGPFEEAVSFRWPYAWVHYQNTSLKLNLKPYTYKTIRSADFYDLTNKAIGDKVEQLQSNITSINGEEGRVDTPEGSFTADLIFSSIWKKPQVGKDLWLWQHFLGYIIETKKPAFDPEALTFMDFRVPQIEGACFMYILPFSHTKALVEYTAFSPTIWAREVYEGPLKEYLSEHMGSDYKVLEEEIGAIPMTNYAFPYREGKVCRIGTAGGASKPSTGYTFSRVQRQVAELADVLAKGQTPPAYPAFASARFRGYDSALLGLLKEDRYPGSKFFFDLFMKNPTARVFSFLDQQTSFPEELKIMATTPILRMAGHTMRHLNYFKK